MQDIQNIFTFSITASDVIANILVALVCGFLIALLYKYTYKGLNYSSAFTISLVMLTMITAIVIMVIGNNLARAFGLVGAMSIIRFRTAVKDASDIMFIFFALAIGLAAGVELYPVAFLGTLMVGAVYILVSRFPFFLSVKREFLMHITADENSTPDNPFASLLNAYCRNYKLVNVKTIGDEENGHIMEYSYYIRLKKEEKGSELTSKLRKVPGVQQVNLFFDED
ncbi:MAG: DUF4956 domain-containing protein [Bacteroidales bacterium]